MNENVGEAVTVGYLRQLISHIPDDALVMLINDEGGEEYPASKDLTFLREGVVILQGWK